MIINLRCTFVPSFDASITQPVQIHIDEESDTNAFRACYDGAEDQAFYCLPDLIDAHEIDLRALYKLLKYAGKDDDADYLFDHGQYWRVVDTSGDVINDIQYTREHAEWKATHSRTWRSRPSSDLAHSQARGWYLPS